MVEEFNHSTLIKVVAQTCQMVGFEKITTTPLLVLADILQAFILNLGRISHHYGEHCGRSVINLGDLSLAFHDCGILPGDLTEFLKLVSPLPKSISVPKLPVTIQNANTPLNSSIDDLIEIDQVCVRPDSQEDSRETLKIKISFSKIKEACKAKKNRKRKNNKQKKKKKTSKKDSDQA